MNLSEMNEFSKLNSLKDSTNFTSDTGLSLSTKFTDFVFGIQELLFLKDGLIENPDSLFIKPVSVFLLFVFNISKLSDK